MSVDAGNWSVHHARMTSVVRQLHGALFDLAGFMNQPQRDAALLREAGVRLDRALFPLLVAVDRRGPVGVVELAGLVGRDHTTVSRQIAALERKKLVARRASSSDRRSRVAVATDAGRVVIKSLGAARERLAVQVLAGWNQRDLGNLARLMRRFADDLMKIP